MSSYTVLATTSSVGYLSLSTLLGRKPPQEYLRLVDGELRGGYYIVNDEELARVESAQIPGVVVRPKIDPYECIKNIEFFEGEEQGF